jgi:hypothetical protein
LAVVNPIEFGGTNPLETRTNTELDMEALEFIQSWDLKAWGFFGVLVLGAMLGSASLSEAAGLWIRKLTTGLCLVLLCAGLGSKCAPVATHGMDVAKTRFKNTGSE